METTHDWHRSRGDKEDMQKGASRKWKTVKLPEEEEDTRKSGRPD